MKTQHALIMAAAIIVSSFVLAGVARTASTSGSTEQRLRKLEDTEAIRELLIAYGRALDKRDFKGYGQLFAQQGSWKGGMGAATGPANIAKMVQDGFSKMPPALYENSNHVMTSLAIEVNGDEAQAWSRWLWVVHGADNKPRLERGGHYEDTLVRENGQWKFKHREAFTEISDQ
jgi:hypothetical protein